MLVLLTDAWVFVWTLYPGNRGWVPYTCIATLRALTMLPHHLQAMRNILVFTFDADDVKKVRSGQAPHHHRPHHTTPLHQHATPLPLYHITTAQHDHSTTPLLLFDTPYHPLHYTFAGANVGYINAEHHSTVYHLDGTLDLVAQR